MRERAALVEGLRRLRWPVGRRLGVHPGGDQAGRRVGSGIEYAGVREYSPGDDPRQIEWNLSARSGRLHVREAHPDSGLDAWLLLDISRSFDWGTALRLKRDVAADLVTAAVVLLARRGSRVGAILFDSRLRGVIPPSRGPEARRRLEAAARGLPPAGAQPEGATDLAAALAAAARVIRRPGLLVVVSDFIDGGGWEQPLRALAVRHEVLALRVHDPREREIPDVGVVAFEDPETGRQVVVDTGNRRLRERFAQAASAQRATVEKALAAAGARRADLSTGEPLLPQLVREFGRLTFPAARGISPRAVVAPARTP